MYVPEFILCVFRGDAGLGGRSFNRVCIGAVFICGFRVRVDL